MDQQATLGVLGGMGPLATVDFMNKLIEQTQATSDQQHIPLMVCSVPQIPDRTRFLTSGGEDPFPAMLQGLKMLKRAGVDCFVIPCNTAHYWHQKLLQHSYMSSISIIDCVLDEIEFRNLKKIGLLATSATINTELYQKRIASLSRQTIIPDSHGQSLVMQGIHDIKAGKIDSGCAKLTAQFEQLLEQGAEAIILGCTEIPLALQGLTATQPEHCLDATLLLAQACVKRYQQPQMQAA